MSYDVIIVGAGVTGAFTARELSKYRLKICLLDRGEDTVQGASRANSGIIHAGFDPAPGTLKARLNLRGCEMMRQAAEELKVPFKKTGSLVLAFNFEEYGKLIGLLERGRANGVEGMSLLDASQLRDIEPGASKEAVAALLAPSAGIVSPYELTANALENAVDNGVELNLGCEVTGITYEEDAFTVNAGGRVFKSRYVVNAAGVNADAVSAMIGDGSFSIRPVKGVYMLLDKDQGGLVERVVFQCPTEKGKGILVSPTVHGNLLVGPTANDAEDRYDTATSEEGLSLVKKGALKSVPGMDLRKVITAFAGLRAKSPAHDFILKASDSNGKFINAAGIDSPGLTSAPAIGEYVAELLEESGLELERDPGFNPYVKEKPRFGDLPEAELRELVKSDPGYGRLVCRCERVTEAEVLESIRRPGGARSVDAVKQMTRAGMGRCQGGFCSPRILEILSRELGIPMEEVVKSGRGSWILAGRTKGT